MMNLYAVTVTLNGNVKTLWIKCRDEADAAERAQAEMMWGGRIERIQWIRREGPSLF